MTPYMFTKALVTAVNLFVVQLVAQGQLTYERCKNEDVNHVINIKVNTGQNETTGGTIGKLRDDMKAMQAKISEIEARLPDRKQCSTNEKEGMEVHKSCNSWYSTGVNQTGYFMVDPDGEGCVKPFLAYCNMSNNIPGRGIPTEVHHDSMGKTKINSKCAQPKCYTREVNYMATKSQIEALLLASANCSQFIRYDCFHSVLFYVTNHYGAWYSRDGQQMSYWGGALPGTGKCACGMSNRCAKPGKRCNCDSNDSVWRSDYGYLTDKTTIPVSMMKFGDFDGAKESGFFTLGPLVCY